MEVTINASYLEDMNSTAYCSNCVDVVEYHRDLDGIFVPAYIGIYIAIINTIIFATGVFCNVVVLAVVLMSKQMHTTINVYIVNLSVCDLCILLVCQPVAMAEYFCRDRWFLGPAMCHLIPMLENTVHQATLLTILAITFKRMDAICNPLVVFTRKGRRPWVLISLTWIIALIMASPFAGMAETKVVMFLDGRPGKVCHIPIDCAWKRYFIAGKDIIFFVLILLIICMHIKIIRYLRKSAHVRRISGCFYSTVSRKNSVSSLLQFELCSSLVSIRHRMGRIESIHEEQPDTADGENRIDGNGMECDKDNDIEIVPDNIKEEEMRSSKKKNYKERQITTGIDSVLTTDNPLLLDPIVSRGPLKESVERDRISCTTHNENGRRGSSQSVHDANGRRGRSQSVHDANGRRGRSQSVHCEIKRQISSPTILKDFHRKYHSEAEKDSRFFRHREGLGVETTIPKGQRHSSKAKQSISSTVNNHGSQIKSLMVIVVYLFISYMPIRVFFLWQILSQVQSIQLGVENYLNVIWILRILMYLHSAANPFIYSFSTTRFMQAFKRLANAGKRQKRCYISRLPLSQMANMIPVSPSLNELLQNSDPRLPRTLGYRQFKIRHFEMCNIKE